MTTLAAQATVRDGPNDQGEMFDRAAAYLDIKAGVREFMVLRDCRHTRIYMRAGTVLDARDYDMNMLADLIKHGRLQVRPKAS